MPSADGNELVKKPMVPESLTKKMSLNAITEEGRYLDEGARGGAYPPPPSPSKNKTAHQIRVRVNTCALPPQKCCLQVHVQLWADVHWSNNPVPWWTDQVACPSFTVGGSTYWSWRRKRNFLEHTNKGCIPQDKKACQTVTVWGRGKSAEYWITEATGGAVYQKRSATTLQSERTYQ